MKKQIHEIERMSPVQRRSFLKLLGVALASPAIPGAMRFAANELAGGVAHAQDRESEKILIEIDLRDQWDQMHVMVPPGIATHGDIRRGDRGDALTFFAQPDELRLTAGGVYLTADSLELEPHLDTVAQIDHCEPSSGAIHGHEAGNAIRSPGRREERLAGAMAMFENDPASGDAGNMRWYGTTPTPASLHNYWQKMMSPALRNGVAFKGLSRSNHTVFHFAAGLPGGELDRMRSRSQLFETFPPFTEDLNVVPTAQQAEALRAVLGRIDDGFLRRRGYTESVRTGHAQQVDEAREILHVREPRVLSLPLTDEERTFWGDGVPNQMCTSDDTESFECPDDRVKAHIWEQMAYAFKLVSAGVTRTVALEFDYMDLHGYRPELAVRTQAKQISRPLARLISSLKAAGIYDRTVIAVYTLDGSRSPKANSYGNDGKNTLILAGGGIRGGYWGDIRLGNEGDRNTFTYHPPDPETGAPTGSFRGTEGRLDSGRVWRTVMRAAGVPDMLCEEYAEVQGKAPLGFVLR
ncbi:MAG: DUF1501 domain-containing protein [Myxococcota bacterium]|nr:DUF1501 domain-containing protein [Myxococcota bacterium]